jgi:hypothetical protein
MKTPSEGISPYQVYETSSGYVYDAAMFLSVPKERIGEARFTPEDSVLERAEEALRDILELERLMADPPRAVRSPPGPIDYPRWGEVYYIAGQRFDAENKRYVVVSDDRWNQKKLTTLVVRLTSRPKVPSDEFPKIGDSQACCGELTAIPANAVELRRRPPTGAKRLGLADMSAIARGVVSTHVIRSFLDEVEIEVVR